MMERQQPLSAGGCTDDGTEQEATLPVTGQFDVLRMKRRKSYTGKTFFCPCCQYICTQKGHLTVHLRTHTGEKPFKCHSCSQAFACVSTLIGHLRVHTGEKPYACQLCEKKFSQRTPLTYHLRKHKGFKPYICRHCGKAFDRNSSLGLHLKKLHQSQPYYCTFCQCEFARKFQLRTHTCKPSRQTCKREEYSYTGGHGSELQVADRTASDGDKNPFRCEHVKCKRTLSLRSHSGQHRCLFDNDNLQQSVFLKTEYTHILHKSDSQAGTIKAMCISEVKQGKMLKRGVLKRFSVAEERDTKPNIFDYEEKVNLAELHKQQPQPKPHTLLPTSTDSSQSSAEMSTSSFSSNCFQSAEIFQPIKCSPPVESPFYHCAIAVDSHSMTSQVNMTTFQGSDIPLTANPQEQTGSYLPQQQCRPLQRSLKPDPFEEDDDDMKQVIETLVQYLPLSDTEKPLYSTADRQTDQLPASITPIGREFKEDDCFAPFSTSSTTALPSFATLAPMAISAGAGVCHFLD